MVMLITTRYSQTWPGKRLLQLTVVNEESHDWLKCWEKVTIECSSLHRRLQKHPTPTPPRRRKHFGRGGKKYVRAGGQWKNAVIRLSRKGMPLHSWTHTTELVEHKREKTNSLADREQHDMDVHLGINTAYQKTEHLTQPRNTHVSQLESVPENYQGGGCGGPYL